MTPQVHDLVRVDPAVIDRMPAAPDWLRASFARAPWLVVRRARAAGGLAVGARGAQRAQRYACVIALDDVREHLTPAALLPRALHDAGRFGDAMRRFDAMLAAHDLLWGPLGSYAFELASRRPTVTATSDLDVLMQPRTTDRLTLLALQRCSVAVAEAFGLRIDVEVTFPAGGASLAECAANVDSLLIKTADGPQLIACP